MDRLVQQMPGQVPQTDVDARDRFEPEAGGVAANAHRGVHTLPVQPHFEWILANDQWRQQVLDDACGRRGADGRFGFTPTDAAGFRLQADQNAVQRLRVDVLAPGLGRIVGGQGPPGCDLAILAPRGITPVGLQRRRLQYKCFNAPDLVDAHAYSLPPLPSTPTT